MPVVGFLIGTSTPKGNFANLDERRKVIEGVWHGYNASLTLASAKSMERCLRKAGNGTRALKDNNCVCAAERNIYELLFIAESKIADDKNKVRPVSFRRRRFGEFSSFR
jgi:hypothetical protein